MFTFQAFSHFNYTFVYVVPSPYLIFTKTNPKVSYKVGLHGQKKTITIFFFFFLISILIMILTQTDMLYSYKCILCEFEIYFQRKPIRPFPKSCNMSLEQTYGKIHIYIYIYISGGPLSALTCCVNARLLSAIKKISPLIYSQSWVGSWVYTTQAMMTFTLIF